METNKNVSLEPMKESDIEQLTPIMERAFDTDAQMHLGEPKGGPEGYSDGSFLRQWGLHPDSDAFTVRLDGRMVGAVIVWIKPEGENFLGNLFIDPELQSKGVGKSVWEMIEAKYPDTKKWYTETVGYSKRNHHFYVNKCGFKIYAIDDPGKGKDENYRMEKCMK